MPNLRDFERRLGGLVEGLFSKTFRSGVQPVELAKRLIKEMDAERTVGPNGVWAPNHFEFALSTEDAERFEQAETALASELAQVARENADERGWGLVGPPEIDLHHRRVPEAQGDSPAWQPWCRDPTNRHRRAAARPPPRRS